LVTPAPPRRLPPRGLAPLGYPDFARFWLGFLGTNTGRWVEQTGVVWLGYQLSDSPIQLGLIGIAGAVPLIVLSPIAGVIADRIDQRPLLIATQLLAGLASLTMWFLVINGLVELWHLYLLVMFQAGVQAFDGAGRQALFPRLVPRLHLGEAVTLSSTAGRASKLIGPAVGGVAIGTFGNAAPFLINALTDVLLIMAMLGIRYLPPLQAVERASFGSELVDGFRYIVGKPVLSGILSMEIAFGIFQLNPVIITIVGREVLHVGPEGLGLLLSAEAAGSFAAISWLIARGPPLREGRFVVLSVAAYSAILVVFALSTHFWVSFAVLATAGTVDAAMTITRNSVMQYSAPPGMRGRIMANLGVATRGVEPLAGFQSGALTGLLGPTAAVLTAAGALLISTAFIGRAKNDLWRFSRDEVIFQLDPVPDA
jgi:MFS family permease